MTPPKSRKPTYHILSDYEMDDIDSAKQIATLRHCAVRYQAHKRFEASLLEAVREINGNLVRLHPEN